MSADSLALLLKAFRLPTMAGMYERVTQEAEQQGWGYRKFLQHLCEAEAQDRAERKLERLLKQSGLPAGKSLGNLEEAKLPAKVRRVLIDSALKTEKVLSTPAPVVSMPCERSSSSVSARPT